MAYNKNGKMLKKQNSKLSINSNDGEKIFKSKIHISNEKKEYLKREFQQIKEICSH
jgi:hypothetical protein